MINTQLAAEIGERPVRPYWNGGTSLWTLAYADTGTPVRDCWSAMTAQLAARRAASEGYTVVITADPTPAPAPERTEFLVCVGPHGCYVRADDVQPPRNNWSLGQPATLQVLDGVLYVTPHAADCQALEGRLAARDPEPAVEDDEGTGNEECDMVGHDDVRTGDNVSMCRRCGAELIDDDAASR